MVKRVVDDRRRGDIQECGEEVPTFSTWHESMLSIFLFYLFVSF